MAKRTVGLYITDKFVDAVELEKGFGPLKLLRFGRVKLDEQTAVEDEDALIKAIQRVLEESNIKTKEVVTALPEKALIIRYFKMSKLPKKERDKGIRFEAQKYIPFIEEIISDFQVIEPEKSSSQMEVIFAAARKDSAEQYVSILRRAGLEPGAVEAPAFSLIRLFRFTKEIKQHENTVLIDIALDSATISILKDRALYLTRDVKPAKTETAEAGSEFENLLKELRLSFDYYKKQFPEQSISRIILSGNGKLEGWDRLLSQELNMPVVISDFRKGIEGADKMPSGLAVAAGLALRGLAKPAIDINLVLAKTKTAAVKTTTPLKTEIIRKIVFEEVAIIGLLLLVLYLVMFNKLLAKKKEFKGLIAQRPQVEMELNVDTTQSSGLRKIENNMAKELYFLGALIDKRTYWTEKLSKLGKFLPEGTWLSRIEIGTSLLKNGNISKFLSIKGNAFSVDKENEQRLVEAIVENVRGDELFTKGIPKINLISIRKDRKGGFEITTFKLICSTKEYQSK